MDHELKLGRSMFTQLKLFSCKLFQYPGFEVIPLKNIYGFICYF